MDQLIRAPELSSAQLPDSTSVLATLEGTIVKEMTSNRVLFGQQATQLDAIMHAIEGMHQSTPIHPKNASGKRLSWTPQKNTQYQARPSDPEGPIGHLENATPEQSAHRIDGQMTLEPLLTNIQSGPSSRSVKPAGHIQSMEYYKQQAYSDVAVVYARFRRQVRLVLAFVYGIKELILTLFALDPRVLALWYAVQPYIPSVPSTTLSMNDSIYLVDAFGHRRSLQYTSHKHFEVFSSFLIHDYGGTPAAKYITGGRFRLSSAKATELQVVTRESWSDLIRPGSIVLLSVLLGQLVDLDGRARDCCNKDREGSPNLGRDIYCCGPYPTSTRNNRITLPSHSQIARKPFDCSIQGKTIEPTFGMASIDCSPLAAVKHRYPDHIIDCLELVRSDREEVLIRIFRPREYMVFKNIYIGVNDWNELVLDQMNLPSCDMSSRDCSAPTSTSEYRYSLRPKWSHSDSDFEHIHNYVLENME